MIPVLVLGYSAGAAPDALRGTVSLFVALVIVLLWAWSLVPGPAGPAPTSLTRR